MSTLLLNLDFGEPPPKKALEGNAKHRNFVKKRRLLERRGFLSKKNQPPSKAPKLHSEPPKKGEAPTVDGTWKTRSFPKKKTAASSNGSGQPLDKKAAVSWLIPAPSKKADSVAAKVDLLGEFQSALPKINSHPTCSQKTGSQKKSSKKNHPQTNAPQNSTQAHSENKCSRISQKLPQKMVAIDCEMVGTGPKGHVSSLAQCSIVNYNGDVLYDEYILSPCHIVDYRTRWSGIRKHHVVNATPSRLLEGRQWWDMPSTMTSKPFSTFTPSPSPVTPPIAPPSTWKADCPENATMSLKHLTKKLLNWDIQVGKSGHSSVEDAQATVELYKLVEIEWEEHLAQNPPKD
uniref:Exonuclease domain-containing protein n=1 Tax=Mandrillus leucophaeus TaxID=9568 RepID=A0A2K5ZZ44_MANLE